MKKNFLAILFLTFSSLVMGQDYKKEIETEFNTYLNLLVNKEFEKSMDFMIPEFFEIFPKQQLINAMEQAFNNKEMEIEIKNPKIESIKDAEVIQKKYYSLLTYSNQLYLKLNSTEDDMTEEEREFTHEMLKASFESTFGEENVKFNGETGFFEIQSTKDVCAISENGKSGWKFITLEKNQKEILERLLPKKILKGL